MIVAILLLVVGLVVLVFGAEALVRGAASLARKLGISPLVVGLTVVAFCTSMPELVVNMFSAVRGASDIAIGNIVGSNISNILLILGISAIVNPVSVKKSTVWKEIPFALLAGILIFIMGNDFLFDGQPYNAITRTDGLCLIALFSVFLFYVFGIAKQGTYENEEIKLYSLPSSLLLSVVGVFSLFVGGKLLVDNAVILAEMAGLSQTFIGLTIVAVGTSLPELATSVVAAVHKHNDIAIGNIVGSNIFNVFWILGLTSTVLELPFNPMTNVDVLFSVFVTILLFASMFWGTRHRLDRWQGVMFVGMYAGYIGYLVSRG